MAAALGTTVCALVHVGVVVALLAVSKRRCPMHTRRWRASWPLDDLETVGILCLELVYDLVGSTVYVPGLGLRFSRPVLCQWRLNCDFAATYAALVRVSILKPDSLSS